ncbi:MAG TPA: glycosyltransferase [Acidimicrobiales bacterium]|nr:glycosyltransferase [Acidimicrobiales bacterium]
MRELRRLALVYPFDLKANAAIRLRLEAQVREFANMASEVRVFAADRDTECRATLSPELLALTETVRCAGPKVLRVLAESRGLAARCHAWKPDLVLLRYALPLPAFIRMAAQHPVVLEVHSDDIIEARSRGLGAKEVVRILRRPLLGRAKAGVFVTEELRDSPRFDHLNGPRLALPNGVALPAMVLQAPTNHRPRVGLLIGQAAPWHGIDLFCEMARRRRDIEWTLIAPAGRIPGNADRTVVEVVNTATELEYVQALGTLDLGLGSLAMSRVGLAESASLKVRDLVAYGIPVALFSKDPDLHRANDRCVRRFDEPIADPAKVADQVAEFAKACQGTRISNSTRSKVDVTAKARQYAAFLSNVATSAMAYAT